MSANTTDHATDVLRDGMADAIRPLAGAVSAVREAQVALGLADSITDAITCAAALILAAEALEDAAKSVSARCRETLRDSMADAGCYSLGSESLTVTLADAPRTATISDKAALLAARPDLFTTPEPMPDRKRIAAELHKGATIEGAHLTNGGLPVLKIFTRKK